MHRFQRKVLLKRVFGEVAEWSIAAVLKTVVLRGTRGSNPCLSAEYPDYQVDNLNAPSFTSEDVRLGVFYLSTALACLFDRTVILGSP